MKLFVRGIMTDTKWWQTLKEGDILLWNVGEWRYKGEIVEISYYNRNVVVQLERGWRRAEFYDEKYPGPKQENNTSFEDRRTVFDEVDLLNEERNWMHKKSADIRLRLRVTKSERDFRIWGEGEGIPDKNGVGGELRYMLTEEALSS